MKSLVRGAVAGALGTWLMDLVTTGLAASQSKASLQQEREASPNGKSSVENLIDRVEATTGIVLNPDQRSIATQAVHFGLGIVPGALYGALRDRVPFLGAGRGVLYGLILWAVNDEALNAKLGLSGPFDAYPLDTHWRGAVGHMALGGATDMGIDLLGGGRRAPYR